MVMVLSVLEMINTKVILEKFLMTLINTVELKEFIKAYNSYNVTYALTHDGVMHICGYIPWVGETSIVLVQIMVMIIGVVVKLSLQCNGFQGAGKTLEMNGSGLRSLWQLTELYNDVEDFSG